MAVAGAIVRMVSIICPSIMNRLVCLFWMILIIVYITVVMIINIVIKAWSWKKINYAMIGDALSCNLRFNHVVIFGSNESCNTLFLDLKSNALICQGRIVLVS
jgi:hypothetical protein